MKEEMLKNYTESLEQKYNAVCFDIDGTLTKDGSKKIDERAIKMIVDLLKRKVPVVFITGRGETGLKNLKNDIYDSLVSCEELMEEDIKRIFVLTNDGARLFFSKSISEKEFLDERTYVLTQEELKSITDINERILEMYNNSPYKEYFYVGYSNDERTRTMINIRIIFKTADAKIIDAVSEDVKKTINSEDIHLKRGIYEGQPVIQLGRASKDIAIERAERIIGIPRNSMIRIGDCGDINGNDYEMLNCNQGYSVDRISGELNSCFPIFDGNGNVLKGVEATLQLIKSAKILPAVCLEKADEKDYIYDYSMVEKKIVLGGKRLLKKFNNIIDDNFNDTNGIDSIFDRYSGSIKIPMYEWEIIKNNPLKEFWTTTSNGNLMYTLRDDNNYLLRGSSTYYYFLANRESINGKDITTKYNVLCWYTNYLQFLENALYSVMKTETINETINKKLILGILDNCRNVLLILINHNLVSDYYSNNILLDVSNNRKLKNEYETLLRIEQLMSKICFDNSFIISKEDIKSGIAKTLDIMDKSYEEEFYKETKEDYSKEYRAYREIDNFGENYVAVSLYNEKNQNSKNGINSCGLSYGGIELPFISKIIQQEKVERMLLLKFNKYVSGYSNKQLLELRKFNIKNYDGLLGAQELENENVTLFDDNVLTGKTLQIAMNSLIDYNINVDGICIVRYPSINRSNQMFFKNTSAVAYDLFFNYIYGLCFPSPYSWKDNDWINEHGTIDYKDSLGVFDLNRKKIIECLLKNHDYKEKSEVGEYRKRLIK